MKRRKKVLLWVICCVFIGVCGYAIFLLSFYKAFSRVADEGASLIVDAFDDMTNIGTALSEFYEENSRLPSGVDELEAFASEREMILNVENFDYLSFSMGPDGKIAIDYKLESGTTDANIEMHGTVKFGSQEFK